MVEGAVGALAKPRRIHVFGDESGNFDFSRNEGASKYFMLTTVTMPDVTIEQELLALRRDLVWGGHGVRGSFHATDDRQAVRDAVFAVLAKYEFRIDCTIFEKAKAQPRLTADEDYFYKFAWFMHLRSLTQRVINPLLGDELFVVAASLGTKKKLKTLHEAVKDTVKQTCRGAAYQTAFWSCESDPCLQVADYCCWAIARKWERQDTRSYDLIKSKIGSEYDLFGVGSTLYY